MKNKNKNKPLKIPSNKKNHVNYTFIDDEKIKSLQFSRPLLKIESNYEENVAITKISEKKYKKKKMVEKGESNIKSNTGLKFINQSQRNHSSIYE
jgi:hypothetical protein